MTIEENLNRLTQAHDDVASAIATNLGVDTDGMLVDDMVTAIQELEENEYNEFIKHLIADDFPDGVLEIPSYITSITTNFALQYLNSVHTLIFNHPINISSQYCFRNSSSLISVLVNSQGVALSGQYMFSGCSNIETVQLCEGVTALGPYVFYGCNKLQYIYYPSTLTSISRGVVLNIPGATSAAPVGELIDGETPFIEYAFVNIPSFGFADIKFKANGFKWHPNCTSIGSEAFTGCSIANDFIIPNTVTSTASNAIARMSITGDLIIGTHLDSLPWYFAQYSTPNRVIFLGHVRTIGTGTFANTANRCTLMDMSHCITVPTLSYNNFVTGTNCTNGTFTLIVPCFLYDAWIVATNWSTVINAQHYNVAYKNPMTGELDTSPVHPQVVYAYRFIFTRSSSDIYDYPEILADAIQELNSFGGDSEGDDAGWVTYVSSMVESDLPELTIECCTDAQMAACEIIKTYCYDYELVDAVQDL